MGTGKNAAVDSAMASSLLMRLLAAGVSCDGALKLVNAALLVKSEAESLATIDAIQIDLYSGKARFYKAGAAPTFLLHASHAVTVDSASLPAGILAGVNFTHSELLLLNGDLIVLCSDGAASGDYDWICRMMEESATQPPEQIARLIAESARVRGSSPREDDITVCVCAVHRYPESLPAKA